MSFAGKNLQYLRKQKGWTQQDFAEQLGIKRSLVGAYEEGRAEPRLEVIEAVCELFTISMEQLLLQDLTQVGQGYVAQRRLQKLGKSPDNIVFVPVKAAAGYLAGYHDPQFLDELNTFTLPMLGPGEFRAFEIMGDSMLPTPSGSVIVGERLESIDQLKSTTPCIVVSRTEGIVYKRVEREPKGKATLTLVSDNPAYPPYKVSTQDVAEIWKAKMVISKPQEKPVWDVHQLANVVSSLHQQLSTIQKR